MSARFDLAIVGSGFGGSLLAMIAKRLGRSVLLLERGRHPRFVIGESSTPLANLVLGDLARRYELPRLLPLTKWGTWQESYPNVGCGLKRGFTFYHHPFGAAWTETADRSNQLLVAASSRDQVSDTHWYRPDFDQFLFREAASMGVECVEQVRLAEPDITSPGIVLRAEHQGRAHRWTARALIDATGPRGLLHQAWGLREQGFKHLPATQSLYSHFTGVRRLEKICPSAQPAPFPVDDAAVHHVFDGGWIWVLRFNNGITSAGVVTSPELAAELRLADGAPAWERLLQRLPTVREQFADVRPSFPFIYSSHLPFRAATAAGWNWALLPSAAGFVDPLLSTGFPLTLLGVERLAGLIEHDWDSESFKTRLEIYGKQTLKELDTVEQMVAALYASMSDFSLFSALSLLYFAAAIYTETSRALGRPELAGNSFLLADHPTFGPHSRECFRRALEPLNPEKRRELINLIRRTIEPLDLSGLTDAAHRNWHPVEADGLLKAAANLGPSEAELRRLIETSAQTSPTSNRPLAA